MLRFLIRLGVLCLLGLPVAAAQPDKPLVPAKDPAELQDRISGILKEGKVPGACVVIADREGILWMAGIGKADVAAGKAVTAETLFRIGSVSKTFAALTALKLVEEGRLSLDAPVRSLVPEVRFTNKWEATDPVRVVHLLEHTTGWDDIHFKEYAHNDPRPVTLAEGLAVGPESRTSRWRPGTRYAYCNSGPAVTAAIVEKITGQRFEDYVQGTFFKPIGMPTADYFYSPQVRQLLTNLHQADGETLCPYWHIAIRPVGSINASARDMGAYLRFFLRRGQVDGGRILTEASLQRMETPVTSWGAQGGLGTGYGLHNYTSFDDRGFVWHGHDGGVDGGISKLAYLPQQGLGFFYSINGANGDAFWKIGQQLQAYVTKDLAASSLPPARPVPASVASTYRGWYAPISPRTEALAFLGPLALGRMSFQATGLTMKFLVGPVQNYVSVDGIRFRRENQSEADLVLMETRDGRIAVIGGTTFASVNPAIAWTRILLTGLFLLALISVPLFALVWLTRWMFRRMRGVPNLHVRVLPLLAWLSLLAMFGDVQLAQKDFLTRLGNPTVWSLALTTTTWAFALFSFAALWSALRARREGMNRWAYCHSLAVAVVFVIATLYLTWFGFIGYRTWA